MLSVVLIFCCCFCEVFRVGVWKFFSFFWLWCVVFWFLLSFCGIFLFCKVMFWCFDIWCMLFDFLDMWLYFSARRRRWFSWVFFVVFNLCFILCDFLKILLECLLWLRYCMLCEVWVFLFWEMYLCIWSVVIRACVCGRFNAFRSRFLCLLCFLGDNFLEEGNLMCYNFCSCICWCCDIFCMCMMVCRCRRRRFEFFESASFLGESALKCVEWSVLMCVWMWMCVVMLLWWFVWWMLWSLVWCGVWVNCRFRRFRFSRVDFIKIV